LINLSFAESDFLQQTVFRRPTQSNSWSKSRLERTNDR
jgi:hypothetical protein